MTLVVVLLLPAVVRGGAGFLVEGLARLLAIALVLLIIAAGGYRARTRV